MWSPKSKSSCSAFDTGQLFPGGFSDAEWARVPLRRGLLYCMEYLEDNLEDWLGEQLEGYGEDDYLVYDCPGQIELYTHSSVFRSFVQYLQVASPKRTAHTWSYRHA
jgi:GTPase SAR1 family protein